MTYTSIVSPHILHSLSVEPILYVSDELPTRLGKLDSREVRSTFTRAVHQWLPKVDILFFSSLCKAHLRLKTLPLRSKRAYHFAKTEWYSPESNPLAIICIDTKTLWSDVNNPNLWTGFFSWTGYKPRTYNLYMHFLHELGHALLGIDHVEDPGSLMYARPNEYSPNEALIDINVSVLPKLDVDARNDFLKTYDKQHRTNLFNQLI